MGHSLALTHHPSQFDRWISPDVQFRGDISESGTVDSAHSHLSVA